MSAPKHTPGPWYVVNDGTGEEPMYSVKAARIAGRPPRHCVAICATGDSPQEMETGNAHLIAAAPEMADALREALEVIESEMEFFRSPEGEPEEPANSLTAKVMYRLLSWSAALAKSEGKT